MYIVAIVIGILIGVIAAVVVFKHSMVGTLRVDRSDPDDQPYMFLELTRGTSIVSSKKYVVLKVSNENYISQK